MSHKRLSNAEKAELKQMVMAGVIPDDISKHFGVAISSVHNFKKQLRDQGVEFPIVRGKRSSGTQLPSGVVNEPESSKSTPVTQQTSNGATNVVINGVSYEVSAQAKRVVIAKGEIRVDF